MFLANEKKRQDSSAELSKAILLSAFVFLVYQFIEDFSVMQRTGSILL